MSVESMQNSIMDNVDTIKPVAKVLLIDLENCPGKIQQLQDRKSVV